MALETLPLEITLHIISYLPIFSINQIRLLSRTWLLFLEEHENVIYQKAASLHGMVSGHSTSFAAPEWKKRFSSRSLAGATNWKTFCQTRLRLRRAWNGEAPSTTACRALRVARFPEKPAIEVREQVHRIKIDEQRKIIITTTAVGPPRVIVRDMDTGAALWHLEPTLGRNFSHLEYSEGFLIFNRRTDCREVWRLSELQTNHPLPHSAQPENFDTDSSPDDTMLQDSEAALSRARNLNTSSQNTANYRPRGCFEPYALLRDKEITRASRFCYPTLLTAAKDQAYLWDIPTGKVVEVIKGIQNAKLAVISEQRHVSRPIRESNGDHELGDDDGLEHVNAPQVLTPEVSLSTIPADDFDDWELESELDDYIAPQDLTTLRGIHYVDHSSAHTFIAGQYILKIFAKSTAISTQCKDFKPINEHEQLVFTLSSSKLRYGRWRYTIDPESGSNEGTDCSLVRYKFDISEEDMNPSQTSRLFDPFKAVHVSPCGSHFAALLSGARLLIVPHFCDLIGQSQETVYNSILDVQLSSPTNSESVYLAYEEGDGGEGRIGVVTTRGIFIVTFSPFFPNHPSHIPHPLRVCRVKLYMDPRGLANVSCLMLSDTYLFITYFQNGRDVAAWRLLGFVKDFKDGLRDFKTKGINSYVLSMNDFFTERQLDFDFFQTDYTVHALDLLPE
ncbi:hypothetical protein CPB83DRAFT_821046 [Crepidotus variabilis]|uniref:F-box domain-containing protein n=1 Tax=Crepidotus variabilis TaxID=179855 RepID=A0A9P6JK14_9AGAR|nr:hypothetical protein CPB83DRAFT_821046 [Crepidotus variabilis]